MGIWSCSSCKKVGSCIHTKCFVTQLVQSSLNLRRCGLSLHVPKLLFTACPAMKAPQQMSLFGSTPKTNSLEILSPRCTAGKLSSTARNLSSIHTWFHLIVFLIKLREVRSHSPGPKSGDQFAGCSYRIRIFIFVPAPPFEAMKEAFLRMILW